MSEETFISDGKLEAKVVGTNQNDKGWYIRLLLHPSDTDEVTKLRVGAVLDIRWREVLNVEVEPIEVTPSKAERVAEAIATAAGLPTTKPKKRFEDYPLSAQCAMRCEDAEFIRYLTAKYPHMMKADGYSAAIFVRSYCNVESRAVLNAGGEAADKWQTLEHDYQNWLTDQRHAESIHR